MKNKIKFTVIIPIKEINSYLEESIPKILEMDYESFEVIILPNEMPKNIPFFLRNKKIRVIASGKVSPAIKRDIGAKSSKADYLAFIDDDAYPTKNWLSVAERVLKEKKVAAIGGPAITPENDSIIQKSSGLFFESLFGGGGMSYRYKPAKKDFYVDDFPSVNFIVSKKAFFGVGGFNNDFWPGEDTKLCRDLIKNNQKIFYSRELIVYHHRRNSLVSHLKQISNYGKHRGYFAKRFPENSFKPVYFGPSFFLIGNILLIFASLFSVFIFNIWASLILIYFILIIIDISLRTRRLLEIMTTVLLVFLSHLIYGSSFLKGLFSRRFKSELR